MLADVTACGQSGLLGTQEEHTSGLALEAVLTEALLHIPIHGPQWVTGQLENSHACPSCTFSSRFLVTSSFGAGLELHFLNKSSPHPVRCALSSFPFYRRGREQTDLGIH